MSGGTLPGQILWIRWGAALSARRRGGGTATAGLHAAARPPLRWLAQVQNAYKTIASSRRSLQSAESNIMENLSNVVGELELLLLHRADDDGDRRSCLRSERWSSASRREGGMSAMVHEHERSLAGRGVGRLAVSQATLLE